MGGKNGLGWWLGAVRVEAGCARKQLLAAGSRSARRLPAAAAWPRLYLHPCLLATPCTKRPGMKRTMLEVGPPPIHPTPPPSTHTCTPPFLPPTHQA